MKDTYIIYEMDSTCSVGFIQFLEQMAEENVELNGHGYYSLRFESLHFKGTFTVSATKASFKEAIAEWINFRIGEDRLC